MLFKRENIVDEAKGLFPDAENELVAVDKYAQMLFSELRRIHPKRREFKRKRIKYLKARAKVRDLRERLYSQYAGESRIV